MQCNRCFSIILLAIQCSSQYRTLSLQEQEELPPWARKEKERELAALEKDLPFGVYLLGSAIVAIAAVITKEHRDQMP